MSNACQVNLLYTSAYGLTCGKIYFSGPLEGKDKNIRYLQAASYKISITINNNIASTKLSDTSRRFWYCLLMKKHTNVRMKHTRIKIHENEEGNKTNPSAPLSQNTHTQQKVMQRYQMNEQK